MSGSAIARLATAASLVVAACGNGEDSAGTSGDADVAGRSGTSGGAEVAGFSGAAALAGGDTSLGGGGPAGSSGRSGASGTSGRSGAGGTSGAGSSAAAGAAGESAEAGASGVLDPHLATPSRDCRTADSDCLSVAGIYDGSRVDEAFETEACGSGGVKTGKWGIGCDHFNSKGRVVLDVPIARPGAFELALTEANAKSLDFEYAPATATGVVALFAGNFVRAELEGTVVVTAPSSEYRIVSGTFHGVWSAPESGCVSVAGIACASAELNVTFRLTTRFGGCFDNSECTPPLTCDSIGFACFNK